MSESNRPPGTRPEGKLNDEAWLNEIFRKYELPLMGYAAHLLGDRDRASDVVQDTFMRLCQQVQLPQRELDDRVRAWLYRVCRNRAIDILKKEMRMKTLDAAAASVEVSREQNPDERLQVHERSLQAESLIANLPARQQEVIRLKVQGGLSYREISEMTGLSVSNVGYLLSTGLKSVRSRLATTD